MIKLIKIGAKWCGPCRTLDPIVEKFKELEICSVESIDIDEQPDIGILYDVKSVPSLVWVIEKTGEVLDLSVGVKTLEWFKEKHRQLKEGI